MTTAQQKGQQHSPAERLKDVGLFRGLAPEELAEIARDGERREHPAGAYVFKEGDPVTGVYVIESGQVAVEKTVKGGKHELALIHAKHVFGEMGFLAGGRPHLSSVRTVEPSAIWHFPADRFTKLIEKGSPAASKVLLHMARVLAGRLDALNKEIVKLVEAKGSAKSAVAELAAFRDKLYKEWSF